MVRSTLIVLLLVVTQVPAQELPVITYPTTPAPMTTDRVGFQVDGCHEGIVKGERPLLASTDKFPNFIGFMSNPLQNIDPRSLTQVVPLFTSAWIRNSGALPDLDGQIYGPQFSLAITDRFSVGLNQGGLAFVHIDRVDARRPLVNRPLRNRGIEFGGTREGFLDLGGFAQYTLIEDVENQFLATVGVRMTIPVGSYELFQGKGPPYMAPYLTVGKEIGNFHFLATTGYEFALGEDRFDTSQFYLNAHVDYRMFDCFYPLVEVNWVRHSRSLDVAVPTQRGIIDLGTFEQTGDTVSLAVGANLVLIPNRLEVGGAYIRALSTERNVEIDAMITKMVIRY